MSDKERVRLILERIMGYVVLEETAQGWNTPDVPKGSHWPIAFWNTDGECWMTRDIATDAAVFDPLHDMNDAWEVLRQTVQRQNQERKETLTFELFGTTWGDLSTFQALDILCTWTPENICDAVLKAISS